MDPDGRLKTGFLAGYRNSDTGTAIERPFFQAGMFFGGMIYGATGGGEILANTATFGATDQLGLTQSGAYQGDAFAASRILATGSRELGITAMTLGTAQAFQATGQLGYGLASMGLEGYSTYQNASSVVEGSINLAQGNALGALQVGFGALGLKGNLAAFNELSSGFGALAARTEASLAERILAADRTGSGLRADAAHRAASFLTKEQLEAGTSFTIKGGDGIVRELLQVPGGMNGEAGIFEYILDPAKGVTHQRFISGGKITGMPNQKVP